MNNLPQHDNLIFHHGSILDSTRLEGFKDIGLVIHLANMVGMRLVKSYEQLAYDTAKIGTTNVLEHTGDAPVVLFSSSSVYGLLTTTKRVREDESLSLRECLAYDGGNLGYACGKWETEQLGLDEAKKGRKVLILRPFNVIGPRQVSDYGMVVPKFIEQASRNEPLTIYGDGTQSRCFSWVDTFIDCIFQLMQQERAWQSGNNIVNVGSDQITSIRSLAEEVIRATDSISAIEHIDYDKIFRGQKDVLSRVPDTTYGESLYGQVQWPGISDIIGRMLEVIKQKAVA
jgi:UDP-glucose 4-epimerase